MRLIARRLLFPLLAAGALLGAGVASAQIQINEIRIDHTGADTDEYFELIGPPGTSLAGLFYVVLGDSGSTATCGIVESITDLSAYSLQADGLLCLSNKNASAVLPGYDGSAFLAFENSDNVTHMLVSGFTGDSLQDLDTNDDGVLDVTPWTAVLDCVGLDEGTIPNCAGEEYLYCATRVGPDGSFVPGHVYRYSDTQAWAIGVFALGTTDTPGEPNFTQFQPPPLFVEMTRDPCVPLTNSPATVVAVVRNDPTSAELRYTVNGGAETILPMEVYGTTGDTVFFFTQIPGQAGNGTLVEYYCNASNANPNPTRSYDQGYFVGTMDIAALRVNDANGENIYRYYGARVRGNVTAAYGVFSATDTDYYVQDATGGINVFQFGPHTVQPGLGDDITVAGALDQYSGKLELSPVGSCDTVLVTIHGPGSPPAPVPLSLCDLREQHEGRLVRVEDLVINTYDHATFNANWNYRTVNCYGDSLELRIDGDTDIPGNPITSSHLEVVGIAGQFDTSMPYDWRYQVQPRSMADITFLGPTAVPVPVGAGALRLGSCVPNPFTQAATIRYRIPAADDGGATVPVRLAVYDVRGRIVATLVDRAMPSGTHTVDLDRTMLGGASGIYFYRLEVPGTTLTRKFVLLRP